MKDFNGSSIDFSFSFYKKKSGNKTFIDDDNISTVETEKIFVNKGVYGIQLEYSFSPNGNNADYSVSVYGDDGIFDLSLLKEDKVCSKHSESGILHGITEVKQNGTMIYGFIICGKSDLSDKNFKYSLTVAKLN